MSEPKRCTIFFLQANDLEASVRNPGLAALLEQGYYVASNFGVEDEHMRRRVALILAPPQPKVPIPRWSWWVASGLLGWWTVFSGVLLWRLWG